jgi:hypothetical protein
VIRVTDHVSQFRVWFSQGDGGAPKELLDGRDFRLHREHIGHYFGRGLPSRLEDLLRIAMSVYVIDRLSRRKSPNVPDGWSRSFRVRLEVHTPEFWHSGDVARLLTRCVEFVSGDRWDFEFAPCAARRQSFDQAPGLFPLDEESAPETVSLYSGGLDSAAGLARRLMDSPGRRFLPVTVGHQSQLLSNVQAQLSVIWRRFGGPLSHIAVPAEMAQPARNEGTRRRKPSGAGPSCSPASAGPSPL